MLGLMSALMLTATPPLAPDTATAVTPAVPPATVVTQIAPNAFKVTAIPGVATAQAISIQNFSDYDLDRNGAYGPMEFAQAMYFLATGDPVPGTASIPRPADYDTHVASQKMTPEFAAALLNTASDEFTMADADHDWRITPSELARFARS